MIRKLAKAAVAVCVLALLGISIFVDSVSPFAAMFLVFMMVLGHGLAGNSVEPQTVAERRRALELKLLRGVAYKPAKSGLVGNPLPHQGRQKK